MESKFLTRNEEKEILEQIVHTHMNFIGNGAARLVFEASEDICKQYCNGNPAVIKVAVGTGGMRQNNLETNTYLEHDDLALAKIYAYGSLIEIMETVSVIECRDFLDFEQDEEEEFAEYMDDCGYDVNPSIAYEFLQVAYSLCDVFGYTSDNGQLGLTNDGCIVAYDYGFNDDGSTQTSDLTADLECHEKDRLHYVEQLADALRDFDIIVLQAVSNLEHNMLNY